MMTKLLSMPGLYLVSPAPTAESVGLPWWVWLLIIVVLILLVWWWWDRRARKSVPVAESAPPAAPPPPDDLTIIEGIGPKIAGLLGQAGITTFAQLADTDVGRLQTMLKQAKLTVADPSTWPEQARLAAAGQLSELEALQNQLKGGRQK